MDTGLIVGLGGAVLATFSTIYTSRLARQASLDKQEREARDARLAAEDSAYRRAADFDQGTQSRMQTEIGRQADQINALQRRVNRLARQLINAGLVPEEEDSNA